MIDAQIKGNFTNSVILTAIGLMLAVIGAFAFTGHMLNPTTVIGALNYMTIGTIVMISQSTVFKNLLYDQIPERVREVLFESTLLELFHDPSRYVQITAYLVACLTLPKRKVDAMCTEFPESFDHCMEKGLFAPLLCPKSPSLSRSVTTLTNPKFVQLKQPDFAMRMIKESSLRVVSQLYDQALSSSKELCIGALSRLSSQVAAVAQDWAPGVGLLGASLLVYWGLLQEHVPHWKELTRHLCTTKTHYSQPLSAATVGLFEQVVQGLGRIKPSSMWSITHLGLLPDSTAVILGTGSLLMFTTNACHSSSSLLLPSSIASTSRDVMVTAAVAAELTPADREGLQRGAFALLVALQACVVLRPTHALARQLLVHLMAPPVRPHPNFCRKDPNSSTLRNAELLAQQQRRSAAAAVWRLSQALGMALALRIGVPYVRVMWLVTVFYIQLCKELSGGARRKLLVINR